MACALVVGARAPQLLRGSWELARIEHDRESGPEILGTRGVEWIPCDAPVPVAAALRAAGRWDDGQSFNFDADDWWYRCRFHAPATQGPLRLRFDGLATVTDVWLNGEHILHSPSMFVGHTVDVWSTVRSENTLLLRCQALDPVLDACPTRPRPRWKVALVEHQALRWVRTSLLGRMRPWCPPIAPVGPWRPIAVETAPIQIESATVDARLDGSDGLVQMRLRVRISSGASRSRPALSGGTLSVDGTRARIESEQVEDDVFALTCDLRLPTPRVWWPHTHGTPHTYGVIADARRRHRRND